jgi:hypothetical protein
MQILQRLEMISEATMKTLKRILRTYHAVLLVLIAGFLLPVSAQSKKLESRTATAKGHGKISSAVDEREITSVLVFLRENGTFLIAMIADMQLQAEGTWKASPASPEEILLKITGGVLKGEMSGSGKLLLASDRVSIKKLTIAVKTVDGRDITITFVAGDSEASEKESGGAASRTGLWLEELEEDCAGPCRYDANETRDHDE